MTVKDLLADEGIVLLKDFCETNEIRMPNLNIPRTMDDPISKRIKGFATCGYYRNDSIYVSVPLCANPNPMYSWPAFIADRTPYGVIQHELGHHVDQVFSGVDVYKRQPKPTLFNLETPGGYYSDQVRAYSGEPPITSYSPNTMEWFAEIFRLFVTNPGLLALIRPRAYDFMVRKMTPVVNLTHLEIMEQFKAPQRVYERMKKWIEKSQ